MDPVKGNVAFSAATSGWSFTLQSFAQLYRDIYGASFDPRELARRFWGDVYFHPDSRTFKKKAASPGQDRTFVQVSWRRHCSLLLPTTAMLALVARCCLLRHVDCLAAKLD